jgi:hypothetical protein
MTLTVKLVGLRGPEPRPIGVDYLNSSPAIFSQVDQNREYITTIKGQFDIQ